MISKVIRKCENCGTERRKGECQGWVGGLGLGENGRSKYGKQYDKRSGWAWWCTMPVCQRLHRRNGLRRWFPDATDAQIDALIDAAELEKVREN